MRISKVAIPALVSASAATSFAHGAKNGGPDPDKGIVALDVYEQDGTIDLLVADAHSNKTTLEHQRSIDGGKTWGEPQTIKIPGEAHNPGRGSDPQIAAHRDTVLALWTGRGSGKFGDGPIVGSVSLNGGETWQAVSNPADDKNNQGHGFVDVAADSTGKFHVVWLDSRDGSQGLHYSASTDSGKTWSANETLDDRSCECCWNRILVAGDGTLYALYRDKAPRDMAIRSKEPNSSTWRQGGTVGFFNWQFDGCPHVGGALAEACAGASCELHSLVWTGMEKKIGLYHLASTDSGKTWSEPKRIGSEKARNADLAANGRRLAAVWDEAEASLRHVVGMTSDDGGMTWSSALRLSSNNVSATHPRVVKTKDAFVVFWTEHAKDKPATWRSHRLVLPPR